MIKAGMLNEMNPKLRALLAAGLIGTAGLGATSCSVDSSYDEPPAIENPEPENPEPENPENIVTFESLGVQPEHFASLAMANKSKSNGIVKEYTLDTPIRIERDPITDKIIASFIYKGNKFIPISYDMDGEYEVDEPYIRYKDKTNAIYYIPKSMEDAFDNARDTYKSKAYNK